ncbi:MAG: molybdopterin-dependent oxidoreductase [Verrucomicrobiota bacterium]
MMKGLNGNRGNDEWLEAVLLTSPHASASIVGKKQQTALEVDGVEAVYFAEDFKNENRSELLAGDKVEYVGQPVALVLGRSRAACEQALGKIEIDYHSAPGVLDVAHAKAVRNLLGETITLSQGDVDGALQGGDILVEGQLSIASQYPLSGGILVAQAEPLEALDGRRGITVKVPCEQPSRVQSSVASVLGIAESRVTVQAMPVLGLSGGRGDESVRVANLAAVAAMKSGRAVSLELDLQQELALTGKRHAVEAEFQASCDADGVILALNIDLVMDAGALSGAGEQALERAMLNADGAYGIADFRVNGKLCRTSGITGSSIWAEGSAQGIFVMEEIIARVARRLGKSADTVRELNFYRAGKQSALTAYGQKIDAERLSRLWIAALSASDWHSRKEALVGWNRKHRACKRGIAVVPVKMGVGDSQGRLNQASAFLQVYQDGSVQVRIARVDVGDGLLERVRVQVSEFFQLDGKFIEVSGEDQGQLGGGVSMPVFAIDTEVLVAGAVKKACKKIARRLKQHSGSGRSEFASQVSQASQQGEKLTAFGFYRNRGSAEAKKWNGKKFCGRPFTGYFYGAAVVEVELDAFTGEVQVLRADLFAQNQAGKGDKGADLNRAQIARAYMMGQAWVLSEQVNTRPCAVPGLAQAPLDFRIDLMDLDGVKADGVESGGERQRSSISCAEAPVAMAAAVREALKESLLAYAPGTRIDVDLSLPAGPLEVMRALRGITQKVAGLKLEKKKSGGKA